MYIGPPDFNLTSISDISNKMSSIQERAKMFSKNPDKDLKKDLIPKKEEKDERVDNEIASLENNIWSTKKIYIVVGIVSFIIIAIVIGIIIYFVVSSKSPSSPGEPSPSDPSKEKQDSDSKNKESDYIKPDCAGICKKPYDILVYNDNALKAKLKECGYTEGSELFTFALSAIKRQNVIRACHNANPLMFNCEIMKISQDYSEHLLSIGNLEHSQATFHGQWMGENLAYTGGSKPTGETPIDMWYEEISNYNFNNPGFSSGTGHFTQVVWKNSKEFGIGLACQRSTCFMTGNYYPGGNFGYSNDYAKNVQNLQ